MHFIDWQRPFSDISPSCRVIDKNESPFRNYSLISSGDDAPPTTIRTSFQRTNRPIRLAESNGSVRMEVAALVVEKSMNTRPVFSVSDR